MIGIPPLKDDALPSFFCKSLFADYLSHRIKGYHSITPDTMTLLA